MGGRLRILHVITDLDVGGAETMLAALVCAPEAAGLVQSVVSLKAGGVLTPELRGRGVEVEELGFSPALPSPRKLARLARIVRERRPAVVQGWMYHGDLAALAALSLAALGPEAKLAWGIRCSDMDVRSYGPRLRLTIAAAARLSRRPDAIVANSSAGLEAHRRLGYRPRRAVVIHNGIDTARFRPDPAGRNRTRHALGIPAEALVVAHVARRDPMKDHETFLAALDRLPQAIGLAVGAGTEGLPDRQRLRRLGRRADVPALLAASDLIVSSSAFGEGFSNAIAEGMACALAPVATDVGDARLLVGETGRLVPPRDPSALAAAIDGLLAETPERRMARGQAARARIEAEFSLARAARAFGAFYADLAGAGRA